MDAVETHRCEFCDEPSAQRFHSWECMAQGVAPELAIEIDMSAVTPAPTTGVQSGDGWVLQAAREFDVYDLWLAGTITDDAMASMIQARVGKRPHDNSLFRARQAGKEQQGLEGVRVDDAGS